MARGQEGDIARPSQKNMEAEVREQRLLHVSESYHLLPCSLQEREIHYNTGIADCEQTHLFIALGLTKDCVSHSVLTDLFSVQACIKIDFGLYPLSMAILGSLVTCPWSRINHFNLHFMNPQHVLFLSVGLPRAKFPKHWNLIDLDQLV